MRVSGEAQGPANEPAHPNRITNANLVGTHVEHVVQRPFPVRHRAANGEASATGFRGDVLEHHAIRVKIKVSNDIAQPRWKIAVPQRSPLDVNPAVEARRGHGPGDQGIDLRAARRFQLRQEPVEQLEADRSIQAQIEGLIPGETR